MLDSLYGDLPPPTKGDGSDNGVSTPAASGSLLGSLYDDPDDPAEASTTTGASSSSSSGSAAVAAAAAAAATAATADTSSSSSAMWASQRLKLLTPAVVRRQTMAKAAPKASPSLNVQAAAADAALVLERLKKLHAGVLAEEQKPDAAAGARASATAGGKGGDAAAGTADSSKGQTEPAVNAVSVTVGSNTPLDPTTWVPVGLWPQEYDPSKPNDYAAIHKEKMRQQQREELERLRQQELEKQKQDEEASRNGTHLELNILGFSPLVHAGVAVLGQNNSLRFSCLTWKAVGRGDLIWRSCVMFACVCPRDVEPFY